MFNYFYLIYSLRFNILIIPELPGKNNKRTSKHPKGAHVNNTTSLQFYKTIS